MPDFFERVATLRREGQLFAVATVVARRAPVSAHLGDRAIIFADGRMEGFVGGACSREIVRQQALEALAARQARLMSIRPDASQAIDAADEHVVVPMTCASEGALDVFIDPIVQPHQLMVVGATPVAEAVARLARSMDYDVARIVDARERTDIEAESSTLGIEVRSLDELATVLGERSTQSAAIVASQGHYDEQALEAILKAGVPYVGLVASRKRGARVMSLLEANGVLGVDRIRCPAGLDLGARTAPEVALSILAEIVQTQLVQLSKPEPAPVAAERAVDPVCGMQVDVATARQTADVNGASYYFCCASCRAKFLGDPEAYLARR
jgi:xanthine dehydrogenase accessory factor